MGKGPGPDFTVPANKAVALTGSQDPSGALFHPLLPEEPGDLHPVESGQIIESLQGRRADIALQTGEITGREI